MPCIMQNCGFILTNHLWSSRRVAREFLRAFNWTLVRASVRSFAIQPLHLTFTRISRDATPKTKMPRRGRRSTSLERISSRTARSTGLFCGRVLCRHKPKKNPADLVADPRHSRMTREYAGTRSENTWCADSSRLWKRPPPPPSPMTPSNA